MDESAHGIVLKSHPYSETSLIIRWITLEQGRIDTIARGARRPKSPFRGKLDLFYLAEFTLTRSRHSDLHALREIRLQQTFTALRADFSKLRQASYASALLAKTTEPGLPIPEIFELYLIFLQHLVRNPTSPFSTIAFELRLLTALGQQPPLDQLLLSPSGRQTAEACLTLDWARLPELPAAELNELNRALLRFLEFHLGRLPPQRAGAIQFE